MWINSIRHSKKWLVALLACLGFFIVIRFINGEVDLSDEAGLNSLGSGKKTDSNSGGLDSKQDAIYYSHEHGGSEHTHRRRSGIGLGNAPSILVEADFVISKLVSGALKEKMKNEDLSDPSLLALGVLVSNDENIYEFASDVLEIEPMVSVAFATTLGEFSQRLKASEGLIEMEPLNSMGYLCKADALFRNGQAEDAFKCLSGINSEMYFTDYSEDVLSIKNTLLKESNFDVVEAGLLSSSNPMTGASVQMLNRVSQMLFADVSNDSKVVESASLMLDVLDSYEEGLNLNGSSSAVIEALTLRENTLRRLPEDFELIDGTSVLEQANQIAQRKVEIYNRRRLVEEKLAVSPYQLAEDYYSIYLNESQSDAEFWLLGE